MIITDLLLNFRDTLLAVAPKAERVGIPWKRPDAYDDWDAIATTLYDNLVINVIRYSLPESSQDKFELPSYDLLLNSYENMSTIEVSHPQLSDERHVFHAFGTKASPFDVIEVRALTEDGSPLGEDLKMCSLERAQFILHLIHNSFSDSITEIKIFND